MCNGKVSPPAARLRLSIWFLLQLSSYFSLFQEGENNPRCSLLKKKERKSNSPLISTAEWAELVWSAGQKIWDVPSSCRVNKNIPWPPASNRRRPHSVLIGRFILRPMLEEWRHEQRGREESERQRDGRRSSTFLRIFLQEKFNIKCSQQNFYTSGISL